MKKVETLNFWNIKRKVNYSILLFDYLEFDFKSRNILPNSIIEMTVSDNFILAVHARLGKNHI